MCSKKKKKLPNGFKPIVIQFKPGNFKKAVYVQLDTFKKQLETAMLEMDDNEIRSFGWAVDNLSFIFRDVKRKRNNPDYDPDCPFKGNNENRVYRNNQPTGHWTIINGKHFDEAKLLNVAHQFQQMTDWHSASKTDLAIVKRSFKASA